MADAPLSTVTNALRLMTAFSTSERHLGVSELARRLQLGKSTTHRLLATLTKEGFVERAADGRYRLGIRLYELGSQVVHGIEIREVAHPVLERLRGTTHHAVHMAVLDQTETVYLERFESEQTAAMFRRIGTRVPAHCTSSGKAILAHGKPEWLTTVLNAGLPRIGPRTLTTPSALLDSLQRTRARGYATSVEESAPGVVSVGAPIFGAKGDVLAAVSVAGPLTQIPPERQEQLGKAVLDGAAEISRGMGFRGAYRAARSGT